MSSFEISNTVDFIMQEIGNDVNWKNSEELLWAPIVLAAS